MTWWDRLWRWEHEHRFGVDITLTVLLFLALVPLSVGALAGPEQLPPLGVAVLSVCAAGTVVPLAWRRTRPTPSVVLVYTFSLAHLLVGVAVLPTDFVVPLALYSAAHHAPRWVHRTALAGALVGSALASTLMYSYVGDTSAIVVTFMLISSVFLTTWAFALVRRSRREQLEALVDRAERLEVERDQQAIIATAAERARIAREMHDIVAHSLSVIIAQADGGRYAAGQDPAAAGRALGTIADTGRAALTDMRRLLGVLRTDPRDVPPPRPYGSAGSSPAPRPAAVPGGPAAASPPSTTAPQPAVDDLESLVDQLRASGMRVSLVRLGTPRHLPPGAGLTIYRVAQESLTNVLKHAGPDPTVTVELQWRPASVVLVVSDDGRGAAADADGLGQGLLGMRERAEMFGGTATAGPRPGGGFRVRVELPTPDGGVTGAPSDARGSMA